MLSVFDVIPEGSIIAYTPYEDVLKIPDRYPKIKASEIPYQPWAKGLFEARSRTRFEPYTRCKPSPGPREVATHQQIWLQRGGLELTIGRTTYKLEEGDCLAMRLDEPVTFRNRTRKPARYIVVITANGARVGRTSV